MRTLKVQIVSVFVLAIGALARAQGTFQNLNFEQANIVPIVGNPNYPYAVSVADALPDWTVDYGNVQQSVMLYNDPAIGGETQVTLYAQGYPGAVGPIIDGNFSVLLQGGEVNGVATPASISQTGQIPSGTQSLLFDATGGPTFPTQPPEVFIGNQQISFFTLGTGTGNGVTYTIFGANISAWSGQTEQLTFTSPVGNSVPFANYLIDDISFSTQSVPEPSPLVLTGLGGLVFALYRRFAPKQT
jgi:hypothetical protein